MKFISFSPLILLFAIIVFVGGASEAKSSPAANILTEENCYWDEEAEEEFCDEEITDPDPNEEGWQVCDDSGEEGNYYCEADLELSSSLNSEKLLLQKNETKSFSVSIANNDQAPANDIELALFGDSELLSLSAEPECEDDLGDKVCQIDSLSAGEVFILNFTAKGLNPGSGELYAFVSHSGEDPVPDNDELSWGFNVLGKRTKECRVPNIKGLRLPQIKRKLRKADCKAFTFIKKKQKKKRLLNKKRKKVWKGIRSFPKAGKVIPADKKIRIILRKR